MKGIKLSVIGTSLRDDVSVDLGQGVKVKEVSLNADGNLDVTVDLLANAKPGDRTLTITGPDCSTATFANALTVSPPEK
jgi:hypothetical protein